MTWKHVREYDTLDELWLDVGEGLLSAPSYDSRDGDMQELCGFSARLLNPSGHWIFNPVRRMHPAYAGAELLWYLKGSNDITMMKSYAPQYERFCNGPGDEPNTAWGAYGRRWMADSINHRELLSLVHNGAMSEIKQSRIVPEPNGKKQGLSQLAQAAILLKKKPETRQCVITCWNAGDLPHAIAGDKNDIPCTLSLQFRIHGGELCCIVTMRSNDIWLGVPYDTFCFTSIQMLLAEAVGVPVGWYQLNVGSMHLYKRDREKMRKACDQSYSTHTLEYLPHGVAPSFALSSMSSYEQMWRREGIASGGKDLDDKLYRGSLLQQVFRMIGLKWEKPKYTADRMTNSPMKQYILENF